MSDLTRVVFCYNTYLLLFIDVIVKINEKKENHE